MSINEINKEGSSSCFILTPAEDIRDQKCCPICKKIFTSVSSRYYHFCADIGGEEDVIEEANPVVK